MADAESYVACCEDLLAKRVFKVFVAGTHADISLNDTFKNPDYFGDAEVNRLLTGIHDRMNKGDAISLHLSTLKTQTAFAVHSTCELIQYLDLPALISSWKMKVETLISDVRGANVLTDTELQDFKMALLGALVIKDQTQHA